MIWSVQVLKEECVSVTPANASSRKTSLLLYVLVECMYIRIAVN